MFLRDLLDHAQKLVRASDRRPKQIDLRRAISSAYYGIFRLFLQTAADELVGKSAATRKTAAYQPVYRAYEHGRMKKFGETVSKGPLPRELQEKLDIDRFPGEIQASANAFMLLQAKRHLADYDPTLRFSKSEARVAIELAGTGGWEFENADRAARRLFPVGMLFSAR